MISSFIAVDVRHPPPPRGRGPYHWPLGKRFYFGGERLAAFGHMSGLLARTGSAGPDEVRRPSAPNQGGELWAPDPLRSVRWSSIVSPCRSSRLRRARQTLEPAFSFRVRCPRLKSGLGVDGGAEGLAGGDDRPDYPGELVGQRHGHDLGRFAGSERGQPVAQRALALWRRPQDRDGAQHKKPSDIPIALHGYRPEFFLAAGRVLFGRRAKPGGEIAAGFEGLRIWRAGQNRRSGERADAGDARRQSADGSRRWLATIARSSSSVAASRDRNCASRTPSVAWTIAGRSAAAALSTSSSTWLIPFAAMTPNSAR